MAKAVAECTCEKCGTTFVKESTLLNRKEADKWEEWAVGNYTLCTDCYRKEQNAANAKKTAEYDLPELTGSEKQVAYAEALRNKWIADNGERVKRYQKITASISKQPEKVATLINDDCPTMAEAIEHCYELYKLKRERVIFTDTSAHEIIDTIKNGKYL